jgi:hypothetical protein
MALTKAQEDVLALMADKILAQQAYDAKVAEITAACVAAESKLAPLPQSKTKADCLARKAEIEADPEVAKLLTEAEALKAAL